jgi:hypothetical protein
MNPSGEPLPIERAQVEADLAEACEVNQALNRGVCEEFFWADAENLPPHD